MSKNQSQQEPGDQAEKFILNQSIPEMCNESVFNTRKLFGSNQRAKVADFIENTKLKLILKINDEYKPQHKKTQVNNDQQDQNKDDYLQIEEEANQIAQQLQKQYQQQTEFTVNKQDPRLAQKQAQIKKAEEEKESSIQNLISSLPQDQQEKLSKIPKQFLNYEQKTQQFANTQLMIKSEREQQVFEKQDDYKLMIGRQHQQIKQEWEEPQQAKQIKLFKPEWHKPWKLHRVIAGHQGWVRAIAMDPGNEFFVTGSNDRTIKFWDLASGQLKITLTGHISPVRGLVVSPRHPYLFSCSEDKTVRCWDLEQNQVIRTYHGHLSGVYSLALHPTLNILASGGRDASVRIWDIRTRQQVHVLGGHEGTVNSIIAQDYEPQIVSGGGDSMIRLWDLRAGTSLNTLTNHKKAIRSLVFHHREYTFASGAPDNIKVWKCPEGEFLRNIEGHNSIINTISLNQDNVFVSGADNDFMIGNQDIIFQTIKQKPQPGSISAENGIFCSTFDQSQMRFLTGECDKTIKIYKEDEMATPDTHPINDFKIEYDRTF